MRDERYACHKSCTHILYFYLFIYNPWGWYIHTVATCMWPHTVYMTYYAYIHVHMYTMYVYIVYMHIT